VELITLEAQAERAVIVPEAGCQCMGYRVGSLEVIAGPPSPDAWREHPFRSGIPILFPWPGRVADGCFSYGGRVLRFPLNETAHGHAIHGLTWGCAFKVTRRGPHFLRAELDSASEAELSRLWPWRFALALDYEIGNGLRIRATVRNASDAPMPFGIGAHPYFHAPLTARGRRDAIRLHVPSMRSRWALDDRMIPTGMESSVAAKWDLRLERALGAEAYDDVFRLDAAPDPSAPVARMLDLTERLAVELRADAPFGEFVLFAPPDQPIVSLEPYTCAPDTFNLAARGIESGMRVLKPGETFEAGLELRVSAP
jgi:aldose 1-epimerase